MRHSLVTKAQDLQLGVQIVSKRVIPDPTGAKEPSFMDIRVPDDGSDRQRSGMKIHREGSRTSSMYDSADRPEAECLSSGRSDSPEYVELSKAVMADPPGVGAVGQR